MSSTINLVTGDSLPDLRFAYTDEETGLPMDGSDIATCLVRLRKRGSTDVALTLAGAFEVPASAGIARYPIPIGALDAVEEGAYEGEHELTHVNGHVLTVFKPERFKIRQQFG